MGLSLVFRVDLRLKSLNLEALLLKTIHATKG